MTRALRQGLETNPRVAIIGGGFIGAEFASVARRRGLEVTLIEREATPFALTLGAEVGAKLTALQRAADVTVLTGLSVTSFHGNGNVESLRLSDGANSSLIWSWWASVSCPTPSG
jgi:NADPH-dependent 2,4-dienoyl-CoA reductase/sulfur reductase-like enzyme